MEKLIGPSFLKRNPPIKNFFSLQSLFFSHRFFYPIFPTIRLNIAKENWEEENKPPRSCPENNVDLSSVPHADTMSENNIINLFSAKVSRMQF